MFNIITPRFFFAKKNVVQFVIAILKSIDVIPRVFYKRNVKKQISTDEYMQ